jgi:hypothetical protein
MNGTMTMTMTTGWMMTSSATGNEILGFRRQNLGCADRAIPDSIPGLVPGLPGRRKCRNSPAGNSGR